jgi:hypothetical protein
VASLRGDLNTENADGIRAVIEPLLWRSHTSRRPS